jgi:GAF domain-containing protein
MASTNPPDATDGPDPSQASAEPARHVNDHQPSEQRLHQIVELAKQTLDGVEDVSLTVIEDGSPRSVVFTGPLAIHLDHHQYEAGFGPCLDAATSGQMIVLDSHDDTPYREFAQTADRAGVRHVVSVGMPLAQRTIGSLNIYHNATPRSPLRLCSRLRCSRTTPPSQSPTSPATPTPPTRRHASDRWHPSG